MTRKILALIALLAVTACSMPDNVPAKDCPRQGGIGGTGGTEICQRDQEVV